MPHDNVWFDIIVRPVFLARRDGIEKVLDGLVPLHVRVLVNGCLHEIVLYIRNGFFQQISADQADLAFFTTVQHGFTPVLSAVSGIEIDSGKIRIIPNCLFNEVVYPLLLIKCLNDPDKLDSVRI